MPLTDLEIRRAKLGDKPPRLWDGGGLYLEISPSGGKWWRWKYRFGGKEKRLSLGTYLETPLAGRKIGEQVIPGARDKREHARAQLAAGIDPGSSVKPRKPTQPAPTLSRP